MSYFGLDGRKTVVIGNRTNRVEGSGRQYLEKGQAVAAALRPTLDMWNDHVLKVLGILAGIGLPTRTAGQGKSDSDARCPSWPIVWRRAWSG